MNIRQATDPIANPETVQQPWRKSSRGGFSMVEVVLALGVLAFAFLMLFGMIPLGEGMLAKSIDATVGMQIVQRVTTLANQSKFSELPELCRVGTDSNGATPNFFFDEQGNSVESAAAKNCIYTASVMLLNESALPGRNASDPSQSVTTVTQVNNANFATINIIIRKNGAANVLRVVNTVISNNGL